MILPAWLCRIDGQPSDDAQVLLDPGASAGRPDGLNLVWSLVVAGIRVPMRISAPRLCRYPGDRHSPPIEVGRKTNLGRAKARGAGTDEEEEGGR